MTSSYSTDLKLELMVTGENAGTWGDNTNNNLNLIQQAIAGYEAIALSDGGTVALAMTDKTISNARNMVIKFTGTLTGASSVTIPDSIEKFYIFDCSAVVGPTNLTIKTASGSGFTLDQAKIYAAYSDGTNLNEISLDTLGGTVAAANITGTIATSQIADDAVTYAKIQDTTTANRVIGAASAGAVGEVQVATDMIEDDAVTADKLANTAVTPGSYTSSSITVDAQGRLTAASSGGATGGALSFKILANGPSSGNTPGSPGSNAFVAYAYSAGGGGGGGAGSYNRNGGSGGSGSYGYYEGNLTGGSAVAYSIGGGGSGGGSTNHGGSAGSAGGATNLSGKFTVNGGNGGNGGPSGANGNPGSGGSAPGATKSYPKNFFFDAANVGNGGSGGKRDVPAQSGAGGFLLYYENDLS